MVFIAVGLDRADKLASVLGAFVGLMGLGPAVFGAVSARPELAIGALRLTGATNLTKPSGTSPETPPVP